MILETSGDARSSAQPGGSTHLLIDARADVTVVEYNDMSAYMRAAPQPFTAKRQRRVSPPLWFSVYS